MARSGRIEARNDVKVNSTSVVLTTDIRLIKQSGDYSIAMITGLPETLSSIQARLDEKQDLSSRLTTFSNQANPSVPKIPQLNTDGTISFIDVPSGGSGGSTNWATPGAIGSTTPNTAKFTSLVSSDYQLGGDMRLLSAVDTQATVIGYWGLRLAGMSGDLVTFPAQNAGNLDEYSVVVAPHPTNRPWTNPTDFTLLGVRKPAYQTAGFYQRWVNDANQNVASLSLAGVFKVPTVDISPTANGDILLMRGTGGSVAAKFDSFGNLQTGGQIEAANVVSGGQNVVKTNDARLSDARTPTAHNQAWNTITGTPTTLAGYGITDAVPTWATPGAIGSTTPNTGNFTTLTATSIQAHIPSIAVTADKTLALSDRNTRQVFNSATAGTITIPTDATVAFLNSTSIEVTKEGTGNVTITPAAGVTFKRNGDVTLASVTITDRYASVFFIKAGTNDWRVFGLSNAVTFADIAGKPTTLAGYGITDALSLGETSDLVYETKDHYLTGGLVASSPVGALGLIPFASGTGAGFGSGTATAANPGVISFNTGTTATGHSIFRSNVLTLQFGTAIYKLKSIVSLSALPNGTDSFNVRFGFGDAGNGGAAIVDGAFFYADQANANWICRTSSNSVVTSTTTNVPVSTNFVTLEVVVNKAGTSVTFSINGTVVATHTTNIPTGTGRETGITYAIAKTVGVTNVFFSLDFAKFYMDGR